MKRSSAAVSVGVKQLIADLCRLLAAAGLAAVPAPETFRRAKFDGGPGVEEEFWQLLANILQKTSVVSADVSSQKREVGLDQRKLVADGLRRTGYRAAWMLRREGEDRIPSSRDLLLALGWLLATGTLESLLTQRAQQLNRLLLTSKLVPPQVSQVVQLDGASLRRLQWLIGCLRTQRRILLSIQEERARLLHHVLTASLSSSSSSSSPSNQSCTVLREECVGMQELCDLLEAYLSWKEKEEIFWSWMDSVVECHQTDPVCVRLTHSAHVSAGVCHHGNGGEEGVLLELPATRQVFRVKLHTEALRRGAVAPGELGAAREARLLLREEARLSQQRDRHRAECRTRLQEMTDRLDNTVLIPPTRC
ncbi:tubulin epsilon and delta complex protein 1 [Genypterus blacodes]|uniref:tubulin epsilon and delta complex protein 1 n=1 Tax=Genypterus blacodes TaxID=154954 RepID=UPI003F75A3DC